MSKIKVFPTPEYTCKQPKDSVVPRLPMTGVLLGPSKSGKSTALVSMILEQYRGCFERIYIASASINVDDSWKPVKKYIEEVMKVPVDREQVYFEDWDEAALRRIINQQRKITETSKPEDAIPLPNFDRGGRRGRLRLPEQENGQFGDRHAVCARKALPDQHASEHPKAAPRKQRRARQQPILLRVALEEPIGEGQPVGGADGTGAQAAA